MGNQQNKVDHIADLKDGIAKRCAKVSAVHQTYAHKVSAVHQTYTHTHTHTHAHTRTRTHTHTHTTPRMRGSATSPRKCQTVWFVRNQAVDVQSLMQRCILARFVPPMRR